MGNKLRINNRLLLLFLIVFATIYGASFLIADTYSHFTAEVSVAGEIVTVDDFGIPLPLEKETAEEQQGDKEEIQSNQNVTGEQHDDEESTDQVTEIPPEEESHQETETESGSEESDQAEDTTSEEASGEENLSNEHEENDQE